MTASPVSPILLPRQIDKRLESHASELADTDTDLERARLVCSNRFLPPKVWRSLSAFPWLPARIAAQVSQRDPSIEALVINAGHAIVVQTDPITCRFHEWRMWKGAPVSVRSIKPATVPDHAQSALRQLKRGWACHVCYEGETPAQALLRLITAGLRKTKADYNAPT